MMFMHCLTKIIEKFEAIDQIDTVLPFCDGVMVARGDLGVELPAEEVPL